MTRETFDDGVPDGWFLTDGWNVIREPNGNWVLSGDGIWQWAVPPNGEAWTDYTVRFRVKLISGGLKTNVRFSVSPGGEWTRYGVGFREDILWFDREYPSHEWVDLCGSPWPIHTSLGEWHDVEFSVAGSHFRYVVDGEVLIDCDDDTPGPVMGTLGFETMDDPPGSSGGSHVHIDDVEVICGDEAPIAQEATGLPLETFEDGDPDWWYTPGWSVVQEGDGNNALYGNGLWQWTGPDLGPVEWTDFTLRFRMKLISGGLHANVRVLDDGDGRTRYMVGFRDDHMWLGRTYPSGTYTPLAGAGGLNLADGAWHDVEIVLTGAHLGVSLGGVPTMSHTDTGPFLPHGGLAFETAENSPGSGTGSYVYIDDVEVVLHEP